MTFSWRGASRDIMRVLWAALGGARAAYASSTAREAFWRTRPSRSRPSKIATRVVACPKNKKKTTTVVGGCWTCRRAKKKVQSAGFEPAPEDQCLKLAP